MTTTHFHLLITHLPIYGAALGAVVLCFGILARSRSTCNAGYIVLLIAAIGGIMAFFTGEPAEETVENIAGVSKELIEKHEESANVTVILIGIMGLFSAVALFMASKSPKFIKSLPIVVLVISIACFGAAVRTGYFGGRIRHTEVENAIKHTYEDKR